MHIQDTHKEKYCLRMNIRHYVIVICYSNAVHVNSMHSIEPSLRIDFLNSSPRVNGNSVLTDFYVNRPRETYSVKCFLTGQEGKDCELLNN